MQLERQVALAMPNVRDWHLEINHRAGLIIELLAAMVNNAKLIQEGKKPNLDINVINVYGIIISEFENSSRGRRLLEYRPEIMPEIVQAYNVVSKYIFSRYILAT